MGKLTPLRITIIYALVGSLWILFSDLLVSKLADARTFTSLIITTGWLFIILSSVLFFWLISRYSKGLQQAESALRNSEDRFRSILETTKEWFWEIDREGRFTYSNPAIEKILGYRPEEMTGKPVLPFVHEDDQKKAREMLGSLMSEKKCWNNLTLRWTHKDKSFRYLESNASPILRENGEIAGCRGCDRDITERRIFEDELIRSQKLESIGVLAGGIAHEFNNALTAIMGNIALLKMKLSNEDVLFRRLEEVEKASMRASDLTQQLITFSRGGTPVKRTINLEPFIRHYSSFALRGTNVSIEFNFAEGLWPVEVDEGQIGQVFNNLILNACHSMPKGGVIKISAENAIVETEEGLPLKYGYYVKIMVEDQGAGIPADQLQKLFDPYHSTKDKGNGLGLAISYAILHKHEGHITVRSRVGEGTTFSIYLPYSRKELTNKRSDSENYVSGKGRVLLMDDEEMVRSVGGAILRELGYQVEFALAGKEAVKLYTIALEEFQPYDAVILDLTVPGGMGGRETIRELLKLDPGVKAIVSSGYTDDPIMSDFSEYGFRDVIPKPYNSVTLSKILHKVITENDK